MKSIGYNTFFPFCRFLSISVIILLILSSSIFSQDFIKEKTGEIHLCRIIAVDSSNVYFTFLRNNQTINTYLSLDQISEYVYDSIPGKVIERRKDRVYLKNGRVINGEIIEELPGNMVSIKKTDNIIESFSYIEVKEIKRKSNDPVFNRQVGTLSFGFALGGGGLAGIPLRIKMDKNTFFEVSPYIRPVILLTMNNTNNNSRSTFEDVNASVMVTGGLIYYCGASYVSLAQKLRKDGIAFKGGYSFGKYGGETIIAMAWTRERFNGSNARNSFITELGLGVLVSGQSEYGYESLNSNTLPILYWKFQWHKY